MKKTIFLLFFSFLGGVLLAQSETTAEKVATAEETTSRFKNIRVHNGTDFVESKVDEAPKPRSGDDYYWQSIYQQISYPRQAQRQKAQGTVITTLTVDQKGRLIHAEVSKGMGYGCDEQAFNAIMQVSQYVGFIPAKKDGKPVSVKFDIPIEFTL